MTFFLELGPQKFAEWTLKQKRPLLITDTTFRDAHQSLMATRVRTYDMLACAAPLAHRLGSLEGGLFSLEMWGGANFTRPCGSSAALRRLARSTTDGICGGAPERSSRWQLAHCVQVQLPAGLADAWFPPGRRSRPSRSS